MRDQPSDDDQLDAAVLRSLHHLTQENALDFCDLREPPTGIKSWLRRAELSDVHGLLIATLYRWHQLRE